MRRWLLPVLTESRGQYIEYHVLIRVASRAKKMYRMHSPETLSRVRPHHRRLALALVSDVALARSAEAVQSYLPSGVTLARSAAAVVGAPS